MVYNVIVSKEAYADLNDASIWYDSQSPNLGLDFVLELFEEISHLSQFASIHAFVEKPIRKKLMNRFPYGIYYSVIEELSLIHI